MSTVLLADDDEELLTMYDVWLDGADVTVRTAADGDEAIRRADDAVDVAVLDRRMPRTSGREVASHIRSANPDCTVLLVSAFRPDDGVDASDYDRYITKPIDREELLGAIDSALPDAATTR